MRHDMKIEIVVLVEKASNQSRVVYFSEFAPADQPMDMYVSETGRLIALYHQEAYGNDTLRTRRDQNCMIYPGSLNEKMVRVGQLYGTLPADGSHAEVSRAPLNLKNIPVDEL